MADHLLKGIDGLVIGDDAFGGLVVAALDHIERGFQLRGSHFAHAQGLSQQALLFVSKLLTM